jgi:hypothetical protein
VTESTWSPDDDAASGESSHEADVNAGFDSEDQDSGPGGGLLGLADGGAGSGAEAGGDDSHAADIDAGYDDESDSPVRDDSGVTPGT